MEEFRAIDEAMETFRTVNIFDSLGNAETFVFEKIVGFPDGSNRAVLLGKNELNFLKGSNLFFGLKKENSTFDGHVEDHYQCNKFSKLIIRLIGKTNWLNRLSNISTKA